MGKGNEGDKISTNQDQKYHLDAHVDEILGPQWIQNGDAGTPILC